MDWFEKLTGFRETTGKTGYETTRQKLEIDGGRLKSRVNRQSYAIGELELVSLKALRERGHFASSNAGKTRVSIVTGDVRKLHAEPTYGGALFQVASQFNLLEMVGPEITPEQGVTIYAGDRTQGPACAIAAGAATIYRNYFAPVSNGIGQTESRQLDGFAELGNAVASGLGKSSASLWNMRNGYSIFTREGADLMSTYVCQIDEAAQDFLREKLHIGLHWDVEVTDTKYSPGPLVSQAFCSALPVSYNNLSGMRSANWMPLATLVLEAAYEATLWAAVINSGRTGSATVLLTQLGGGAFGNDLAWIRGAMQRAIERTEGLGLDIVVVSYGQPSPDWQRWAARWNRL